MNGKPVRGKGGAFRSRPAPKGPPRVWQVWDPPIRANGHTLSGTYGPKMSRAEAQVKFERTTRDLMDTAIEVRDAMAAEPDPIPEGWE